MKSKTNPFVRFSTLLTAVTLLGMAASSQAVIVVAGGNGDFESTLVDDMTYFGAANGIYDGGFTTVEGWTFSGPGTAFRWLMTIPNPYGPVVGTYALNLTAVNGAFANVASTTVTGLTIGQNYTLSFDTAVRSGGGGTVDVKVDGSLVGTIDATVGASYVTKSYSFTAADTTATLAFEYASTAGGNGYMLDNVTVVEDPWVPADGIWTGADGDGNWNTAGNWNANTIGQGIDKSATFNGLAPVTATVNVSRPIGSLIFSGANHTIAAGTGVLTLDGDTVFATPTATVDSAITATIAATLNGSEGLLKNGAGTLVLSALNTYTGGTSVANGTLTLELAGRTGNNTIGSFDVAGGATLNLDNTNTTLGGANEFYPANIILTGAGTLTKTNVGSISFWTGSDLTGFTGTVDVQEGALRINNINSGGNMPQATLNIASGATFDIRFNSSLSVDKLTGAGTLDQTFDSGTGLSVTVGANDGSSTFDGVIQNGSGQPLALTKAGTGTFTLAGINTYSGDTTVNAGGTLVLADNAQLRFVVTDSPDSNMVTGSGTATFNGDFNIDTSAVTGTTGFIWTLVDRATLTGESFDSLTFNVFGFDDIDNDGIWEMSDAKGDWSFDESTGELTLVALDDYETWVTDNGVTGGPDDDDDNDGLTNHEEYAFGLDPTGGSSVNPITSLLDKGTKKFSYTRRDTSLPDPALNYTVWFSTDLSIWTQDTGATESVTGPVDGIETVEVTLSTIPGDPLPAKLFIQVRAE